mgnify:CR=1 FL=1
MPGHHDVGEDDVRIFIGETGDSFVSVGNINHPIEVFKGLAEVVTESFVVFYNEQCIPVVRIFYFIRSWLLLSDVLARCSRDDSCDTGSATVVVRGNVTMKVVPLPSSEQKVIFPCSIFTMRCTCNSPNPVPSSCDCRAFSAL